MNRTPGPPSGRPRIRTIKPDAWQDERLGQVTRDARLLWVALITLADDEGRFRANVSIVVGHAYPYDDDAAALVPAWLDELDATGLVTLYAVGRARYGAFPKWREHQRIERPKGSRLPPPPGHPVTIDRTSPTLFEEDSRQDPGSVPDRSVGDGIGGEGKGGEQAPRARVRAHGAAAAGRRLSRLADQHGLTALADKEVDAIAADFPDRGLDRAVDDLVRWAAREPPRSLSAVLRKALEASPRQKADDLAGAELSPAIVDLDALRAAVIEAVGAEQAEIWFADVHMAGTAPDGRLVLAAESGCAAFIGSRWLTMLARLAGSPVTVVDRERLSVYNAAGVR